jgi:hypothetical protein
LCDQVIALTMYSELTVSLQNKVIDIINTFNQ